MTYTETEKAILMAISRIPKKKHREAALAWLKARVDTFNAVARLG